MLFLETAGSNKRLQIMQKVHKKLLTIKYQLPTLNSAEHSNLLNAALPLLPLGQPLLLGTVGITTTTKTDLLQVPEVVAQDASAVAHAELAGQNGEFDVSDQIDVLISDIQAG